MKIFNLQYVNSGIEGMATVEALNANRATIKLQSEGRLNANKYEVTSIVEVGCNDSPAERIITEVYNQLEDSSESIPTPKFDIDSLSNEDIEKLKLKINKYTGTLYVDKITGLTQDAGLKPKDQVASFRPKAKDGYTFFYINPLNKSSAPSGIYVKRGGKNTYIGFPFKYDRVESPSKVLTIARHADYFSDTHSYSKGYVVTVKSKKGEYTSNTLYVKKKYAKIAVFIRRRGKGLTSERLDRGCKSPKKAHWSYFSEEITTNMQLNEQSFKEQIKELLKDKIKYGAHIGQLAYRKLKLHGPSDGQGPDKITEHYVFKFCLGYVKRRCDPYGYAARMQGNPIVEYTINFKESELR